MGLFSRFKSSMSGGVQVHVQAPSSVAANQVIPVTVNITSDSAQTINGVKAEVKAQAREEGISMRSTTGVGINNERSMDQTVAQAESRNVFSISPGETKTVTLQLYLNGGAAGSSHFGAIGNTGGAIGGVMQTIATAAQAFEHVNYIYSVHAQAIVQGHSIHPSDKQSIQVLPASESNQAPQQQS